MPLTSAEESLLARAAILARETVSPNAARWERVMSALVPRFG